MAIRLPGKPRRWPCCSANIQAATTAKAGLQEFGRLQREPGEIDPAPGALDLAADEEGEGGQRQATTEADHGDAPDRPAGACSETAEHDRGGDRQQRELAADEMQLSSPDAVRHRRARRQREQAAEGDEDGEREPGSSGRPSTTSGRGCCGRCARNAGRSCRALRLNRSLREPRPELRKRSPRASKLGELIEGGAGRRQQHDRPWPVARPRHRPARRQPRVQGRRNS